MSGVIYSIINNTRGDNIFILIGGYEHLGGNEFTLIYRKICIGCWEDGRTNLFSANVTLIMHSLVLLVKRLYGMLRLLNKGSKEIAAGCACRWDAICYWVNSVSRGDSKIIN